MDTEFRLDFALPPFLISTADEVAVEYTDHMRFADATFIRNCSENVRAQGKDSTSIVVLGRGELNLLLSALAAFVETSHGSNSRGLHMFFSSSKKSAKTEEWLIRSNAVKWEDDEVICSPSRN
jgi:hypothetical protein